MKNEEFKVPKEIDDLFASANDAEFCCEKAIASWFYVRKALKFANKARELRQKAWYLVVELYPQLRGKHLQHNPGKVVILAQKLKLETPKQLA